MKKNLKTKFKVTALCVVALSLLACSEESSRLDPTSQIEDLEMVITAEQGRVQTLEKEVSELKIQLSTALDKINELENVSNNLPSETGLSDQVRRENAELVRLVFQSMTDGLDMKALEGLISTYDSVYKLSKSPEEDKGLIWVTGKKNQGDLYLVSSEGSDSKGALPIFLGRFENLTLAKWSPDNKHLIIETESKGQLKGHLINIQTQETLATMEYTGLPIWAPDGRFFVYLNENPNELYTGTETRDMYATGVFMYSFKTQSFSIIDPGGSDYICKDLGVKASGEITYIQKFKEGKESYASVLID
ncbi:TolB family protein [Fusibacter sp. JL216-2]|uniref:TolB family protein n=1 Tax=Fusibacter sp. JL216-2 TaxID=3071453 RepID=UPI003D34CFFE